MQCRRQAGNGPERMILAVPLFDAVVKSIAAPAPGFRLITFRPEQDPGAVRPGQFWHVTPRGESLDPLLRRPFSVYDVLEQAGLLKILFRTVGRGTRTLGALAPGNTLSVLGPLGNGFTLPAGDAGQVLLIGGGAGAAPLYYLARKLKESGPAAAVLLGARNTRELVLRPALARLPLETEVATDDGSAGFHGPVTELLRRRLHRRPLPREIFCCGPAAMMAAVLIVAREYGLPVQASLEEHMACGIGACMGCVFPAPAGPDTPQSGQPRYRRLCREGPVVTYRFQPK